MSLNRIDRYIKELEAVKNYTKVKANRDLCYTKNIQLQTNLLKMEQEKNQLQQKLKEKNAELDRLKETEKNERKLVSKAKTTVKELRSRVKTLEGLKAIVEGKTLSEAESAFIKSKDEEIKRRADEASDSWKSRWEHSEKPRVVFNETIKELSNIVDVLSRSEHQYFTKELVDAGVPLKVQEIISSEVKRRLDIEWPEWFETNIETRVEAIKNEIKQNAFKLLKDLWEVKCDECGCVQTSELTSQDLATLLREGYMTRECVNPNCNNQFGRHKIRIDLKLLIAQKLKYSN